MLYDNPQILKEKSGNNAFAWEERTQKYGQSTTLFVPSIIEGTIEDVQIGNEVVFEEIENGKLKSCVGLRNFVHVSPSCYPTIPPITIFDNHNHALYFWIDAVKRGILQPGFTLIHIDEHSDLWENQNTLDLDKALQDEQYAWDFANLKCNVGNYIQPAIESGLVSKIIRIENESQIDTYMNFSSKNVQEISQEQEIRGSKDFSKGVYSTVNEGEKSEADKEVRSSSGISTVLNLDLDIFAPELDFIPEDKKIRIIRNLLRQVDYVTIATSPFFIDQGTATQKLHHIFNG